MRQADAGGETGGLFVTIEGVEGCGKTTRAVSLVESLRNGPETGVVLHTREPGGPPVAEGVRAILLDTALEVPPLTELFLYLASRSANVAMTVAPALEQGYIVVCERFSDATLAYQVGGRGLPREPVEQAIALATDGLVPELTILLDLDPAEGFRRHEGTGRSRDRIESESIEFHRRVRDFYLELAAGEPDRFVTVDAAAPQEEQDSVILSAVRRVLDERRR